MVFGVIQNSSSGEGPYESASHQPQQENFPLVIMIILMFVGVETFFITRHIRNYAIGCGRRIIFMGTCLMLGRPVEMHQCPFLDFLGRRVIEGGKGAAEILLAEDLEEFLNARKMPENTLRERLPLLIEIHKKPFRPMVTEGALP